MIEALRESSEKDRVELLRLLPHETMLKPVVQTMLAETDLGQVVSPIGTVLQYTDAFNFGVLGLVKRLESQSERLVVMMASEKSTEIAQALVKGIQA